MTLLLLAFLLRIAASLPELLEAKSGLAVDFPKLKVLGD